MYLVERPVSLQYHRAMHVGVVRLVTSSLFERIYERGGGNNIDNYVIYTICIVIVG